MEKKRKLIKKAAEVVEQQLDLRSIVDIKRPFTIFFSGVENEGYLDTLYDMGIRNFLMSYEYLKGKGLKQLKAHPDMHLFIDSGAYTYINDIKYHDISVEEWEDHIVKYLDWGRKHKDGIFAMADLDLQYLVGYEKVKEWREKYFEPFMLETGIPICFIYHEDGEYVWEYMCKRYPYLGISMATDSTGLNDLRGLFKTAEKYNTVVQGMGSTNTKHLTGLPFYTVDSSVDGDSSIMLKDDLTNSTERMTISELYSRVEALSIQTTPTEMRAEVRDFKYRVLTVDDDNKVVWERLNAVVKHTARKKTLKITLEGGQSLTCTDDHSLISMDKNGSLYEIKASDLGEGGYVLSPQCYDIANEDRDLIETLIQKPNFSKENLEVNVVEISDELLQFFGIWIADGHYSKDQPTMVGVSGCNDPTILDVVSKVCSVYNAKPLMSPNKVDVRIYDARFRRVMDYLGFQGNSKTKRVPKFIYSLSEYQICQFLRGYFSSEGTGTCEVSTVSEELKNDIVELLNMLNIYTSVSYKPPHLKKGKEGKTYNASGLYHIHVRDITSKIVFRDKVGFIPPYKSLKLDECIKSATPRCSKKELIPRELKIDDTFKGVGKRLMRKHEGLFNPKVVNSQLNFLQIKSIEVVNDGSEEVEVFDLSVEKYERFIANGVLVHNTTWNIGLKYGEMSIWRGTNMGRVKKADFETRAFPCVRSYSREFNLDLIREEDNTTMIQVNAWAFIEAEKYIRDRLKASMYWLKTRASNNDLDNLPDDFFPSPELLRLNDQNTLKEYASKMNINPDSDVTSARVLDMTTFLNWDDPDYEEFHEVYIGEDKLINQYHDFFINRIVQSEEEKLEDLIKFYKECLSGKNDRLLQEGTNFDRIVRDRDEYIEEEEYEEIDVGIEEINRLIPDIQLRLTTEESAPDIEELDKEIFSKTNVQVHRDEKGRILKGTSIRKLNKKMYSDKYPKYACDTCIMAQKCPEYQAGFVCAYNNMFKRFDSRNMSDLIEGMQGMVEFNLMRMQRAMMAEVMSGGVPDPQVTQFINQNMSLMNQLKGMYENAGSEVLRQTKVVRSDGSQETNTIVQNPQSGGILEQLFSNVRNKKKYDEDVVEAELIEEVD